MKPDLLEDLFKAYYDARRNKRNTRSQLLFELELEKNLMALERSLVDRTWRPGPSVAFIIDKPVKREVFAASFADRVVHHLFYNYTEEIFERSFIDDSYSCRKGRGTSYGIKRLDHHIRSCSHNYTRDAWVLKLDLSGYFMSIDRQKLHEKVAGTLMKAPRKELDYGLLLYLTERICLYDPLDDCRIKGSLAKWRNLPADKSLFGTAEGCGLPIGNLTSQLFSNIYLNGFDHWVKRALKLVHYGRYVDDFYLIHTSKNRLLNARTGLTKYLIDNLDIRVHPKKVYMQHTCRGVAFLGVFVRPFRTYVAHCTFGNFKASLARGARFYANKPISLVQTLCSYLGLLQHYNTFGMRSTALDKHSWLSVLARFDVRCNKFGLCRLLAV